MRSSFDNMGRAGMIADQPPWELPKEAWSYSNNFRFADGAAESINGFTSVFSTPPANPYSIVEQKDRDGNPIWFYGTETELWLFDGNAHGNVGSELVNYNAGGTDWQGTPFNEFVVFTNGVDIPQRLSILGGGFFTNLNNWESTLRCEIIRSFKNYLFALKCTENGYYNPQLLRHSNGAQPNSLPSSWDYTDPNEDTGRVEFGQTKDFLVDCMPLRDVLVIYKDEHVWAAAQTGGVDNPFQYRQVFSNLGLISKHCIADVKGQHVIFSYDDAVVHDLNATQQIFNKRDRRYLYNSINQTFFKNCYIATHYDNNEVWFCYPGQGATYPNAAAVWNWEENNVYFREFGFEAPYAVHGTAQSQFKSIDELTGTIDDLSGSIDIIGGFQPASTNLLFADPATPSFYALSDSGGTYPDGRSIRKTLIREALPFGDILRYKRIHRVFPKLIGPAGQTIKISVGTRNAFEDSVQYSSQETFTIGTDVFASFRNTGRIIDIKFEYEGSKKLRFHGFDIEWEPAGLY